MSPQCHFHDPVFPSLTTGAENYKQHMHTCRNAFPDLKFTIEDEIAERNEVVLHWKMHGTHRGTLLGMPATNKVRPSPERQSTVLKRERLLSAGQIGTCSA